MAKETIDAKCDIVSKEYFSYMVKTAISDYGISRVGLAEEMQIPPSTVDRWAAGTAVPHPLLRKRILEWIINNTELYS